MTENHWHFPDMHGTPPRVQHQEQMARPQGNYTQGQYIHPKQFQTPPSQHPPQYTTPEHQRAPFDSPHYTNPLTHTLPRPPDTPIARAARREDAPYADLSLAEAMARDERMNDECVRAARVEHDRNTDHAPDRVNGAPTDQVRDTREADRGRDTHEADRGRDAREADRAADTAPQAKAAKKKVTAGDDKSKKKKLGPGARSGALNRRAAGGSDGEIEELDAKEVEGAAVTPHSKAWTEAEKLQVITYVTSEKVWKDWKVNKAKELLNISQKLFGGKHDGKAVDNLWSRFWAMFKIVRQRQDHTGGGDGDDDGTDLEGGGDGADEGTKKRKVSKRVRFSKSVLDTFEHSVYFEALDAVAHNHVEIVRPRAFNSALNISDDEDSKPVRGRKKAKPDSDDSDETGGGFKSLMETLRGRNVTCDRVDAERLQTDRDALALAQRKEDREARLADARWVAEKEAKDREEERRADAAKCEKWDRAMKWMESPNLMMQAMGEKLAKKLAEEEGIPVE
ncbi:hypothetical protein FIBSPDRAFT_881082 [Athelia psychrophila]|uniref:No apical meristem-associated C-terminal domain-containing protein n=1 Tax=Athelia psychrophila TaxID=1759441 RepID=A0A166X9R6_9AGAM|nr:hypothetical protein FIBSPDRAFT_881082 [Fibularhizoctonia sp. CBS 109695]